MVKKSLLPLIYVELLEIHIDDYTIIMINKMAFKKAGGLVILINFN